MRKHLIGAAAAGLFTLAAGQAMAQVTFTGSHSPASIAAGGSSSLSLTVTNNTITNLTGGSFTYTVQAGVTVNPAFPGTCTGASISGGGAVRTFSNISVLAGGGTCSVSLTLAAVPGSYPLQASSITYAGPGGSPVALTTGANPTLTVSPSVTALSPTSGVNTGGTTVTITGTGFLGTTGAAGVRFGATNAASYTVSSNTQINAVSPAGATGVVNVSVTNNSQTSADTTADDFSYTVPIPTLSEWAMILFGMLLAGGAALMLQRRRILGT